MSDKEDSIKSVECATDFRINNKLVHHSDCSYPIEKSKLNIEECLITLAIRNANIATNFDINLPKSITVNMSLEQNAVLPKVLAEAKQKCAKCKLRQRERGC